MAEPHQSLLDEGVIVFEDAEVGSRFFEFRQKRYPFQTEDGLEFCRKSTIGDQRVRSVLEMIFERCELGLMKLFGPKQDVAFAFLNNEKKVEGKYGVKALYVLVLPRNSTMVYYKGSHLHALQAQVGEIGLLQVLPEKLAGEHITPYEVTMKDGGLAIIDGRLAFRIVNEYAIVVGFAVDEELKHWGKRQLPNRPGVIQKIKEMQSEKIGIRVEFVDKRFTATNVTTS